MSSRPVTRVSAVLLSVVLLVTSLSTQMGSAVPGLPVGARVAAAQNVDWMSSEQASILGLDFAVLVPSWVPGPFGGSPSVQAGGGYYSLYWMIPGGDPTFLQVTGEVGGRLPAGSPADLNQQLFINAWVQGYDAIHDVTSIYDNVWWIAGGVLYTVSSKNMTGTDSLSLANSLVALQVPADPEPEPTPTSPPVQTAPSPTGSIANASSVASGGSVSLEVYPSGVGTLRATQGTFASSGASFITGLTGGAVSWQAPSVGSETTVEFILLDAETGAVTDWSSIVVYPTSSPGAAAPEPEPESVPSASSDPDPAQATDSGDGGVDGIASPQQAVEQFDVPEAVQTPESGGTNGVTASDGTAGPQVPRTGDGTEGPLVPRGGDGTGGIRSVSVP